MRPGCTHRWIFLRAESYGEDRTFRYYECEFCGRWTRRNVKNARYVPKTQQKAQERERKPIRKVSSSQAYWNRLYRFQIDRDSLMGVYYDLVDGKVVRKAGGRLGCERHHPAGRHNHHLLAYIFVTKRLHEWIHGNGTKARSIGALLPEFEGRESGPDQLDPFSALLQMQELRKKYEL